MQISCIEESEFGWTVWYSPLAQMVKNPPAMWETRVRSLGWEDPLEEGVVTHSSIFAWRIPMNRGAGRQVLHCPEYSVGYIFIIKGREGKGRTSLSFLNRCQVSFIGSSPK